MKNILATLIFLASTFMSLNAEEITGEAVYKAKCASCHNLNVKKEMTNKERIEAMKERKAPPMSKVSAKVRDAFKEDTNKSIAFVADYIVHPDINKSLCMPMAIKKFGVMPAVDKSMTSKEIEVVSKWLINNFDGKWSDVMKTKCKGKSDPCCAGETKKKCGSDKNSSKKCGGDKMPKHPAMKCGSDKNSSKKCGGDK
jgi:mono/diheme cytochrome c family protein